MAIQKTVVVGAGPVGCLAAIYAASRGDDVEIYELRGDLRDPSVTPLNFTRSINLALSERGINAIRSAHRPGLLECVLENTIPMHGRMIHGKSLSSTTTTTTGDENDQAQSGLTETPQQYDVHGRFIRAADRGELNMNLLDELEDMPNVQFFFNHKLVGADFRRNVAWFEHRDVNPNMSASAYGSKSQHQHQSSSEIEVKFDFMIGADGAHSAVRYHLMKFARMNYQQDYIDTLWCEFHIEPKVVRNEPDFKLSPDHLHIWPGGSFMFIAIPSTDKSFTSTLFLSASKFAELDDDPDALVSFFEKNFPGVVPDLISVEDLIEQYTENPHLPLISIKCHPYHYSSSAVILGDAAHAMVPFYGQGMNAGLESVRVLFEHLDKHSPQTTTSKADRARHRAVALDEYTKFRHPDARAICDLAFANYAEMSSHVQSPLYLLRKTVEEQLSAWLPSLGWATQYSRVSFGNERYSDVQKLARHQQRVLSRAGIVFTTGSIAFAAYMVLRLSSRLNGGIWERIASLWSSR